MVLLLRYPERRGIWNLLKIWWTLMTNEATSVQGFCMVLRFSYLGFGVLNSLKFFGLIWSNMCVCVWVCAGLLLLEGPGFSFCRAPSCKARWGSPFCRKKLRHLLLGAPRLLHLFDFFFILQLFWGGWGCHFVEPPLKGYMRVAIL